MQRLVFPAILVVLAISPASAGPLGLSPPDTPGQDTLASRLGASPTQAPALTVRPVNAQRPNMGGGFLEMLFGGPGLQNAQPRYEPSEPRGPFYRYRNDVDDGSSYDQSRAVSPQFLKQMVSYAGNEKPGTIIINTNERLLYLVQEDGRAIRYGIGVGRPGFTWAGVHHVTRKREWPDWTPPPQMLQRRPDLPRHMEGGPENPLGARAMYLGSSLYRIHGSNEPWTIGQAVSSGCIRMRNEDVIDLYERVKVGTKVLVI